MTVGKVEGRDACVQALRAAAEACGSQRALADHAKVSDAFLSDMLRGHRAIPDRLASLVGFERVTVYRKKP